MFSHIMIGTNDLEKAKAFYDALLGTLGVKPARVDGHRIFYRTKTGVFSVSKPINGEPATHANGGTIGFAAESPNRLTPGTRRAWPMAPRLAKIRRAFAKAPQANYTSLTCAISTATRSARCIGWRRSYPFSVMAGLVPAIHVFVAKGKTWMPGTRPGMTAQSRS